jgi:hypothetical protein
MADMAPDTAHSSAIDSHPFIAPPGEPWERCVDCKLARSAHVAELAPYAPDRPRAGDGE